MQNAKAVSITFMCPPRNIHIHESGQKGDEQAEILIIVKTGV